MYRKIKMYLPLIVLSFVIYLIGMFLSLGASLYLGTQEFNYYCHEAQLGNPRHIYFPGPGPYDLGGFEFCVLNTLSINLWIFFLGSALVIFIIQIVWLWSKNKWSLLTKSYLLFVFLLLSTLIITLSTFIFPQVRHGFMEGGTWLDRWTWSVNTPKAIFFISLGLIISNLGPWIVGLFFKKSQEDKAIHVRLGGFIWFIITIAVTQIVVFVIIWLILVGGNWLFQFFKLRPRVYTHPTQIYLTPKAQPNPQNKTIINRTLNLPSPGIKPGMYNINSIHPASEVEIR